MRLSFTVVLCITLLSTLSPKLFAQAGFTGPAEVFVNDPVTLTNTTTGGATFFWNFCSGNVYNAPAVANLGHITGMDAPVFIATAKEGNDYYAFFTNNNTPSPNLYRLYFGSSLLNTPTVTNLGSFGGVIPYNTEGVQVVEDADGWHVLVVGSPLPDSRIVKVDFGPSLTNPGPVAVDWGNIGNLSYPHDLFITRENNQWYGFTVNAFNNTITRFDFGTNFRNPPTGVNLGNTGNFLSYPTGIFAIRESGNWHVFITNRTANSLTRLDFGSSLVNTPTPADLGNPNNQLVYPRDLCVIQDCGKIFGLVVNETNNDLVRIDFQGNITSPVAGTSLGSQGLDFPHSISTLFRVDNSLYAFVVNARNNTLARIAFNSCTNSSVPSSTQQQPPAFSYNAPGTYTVNLITDEGLPTQSAFCQNIVVKTRPPVPSIASFTAPDTVCVNMPVNITNTSTGGSGYFWNFCSGSLYNQPQLTNLGNIPGMDVPVFIATAKEGNDYYAFITNNGTGSNDLLRLSFGNSYLNQPVVTNLGSFGGIIPLNTEGVQVVQDADGWHAIIVGGANSNSKIVKVDFGASLGSNNPIATDWGNIGTLNYPVDLYVFQEGGNWHGLTVNFYNNSITRFDFGTSFQNPPVGTNLGNLGALDYPAGIFAKQENGNWYVFVTNRGSNTITRFDYGTSLLNTPSAVNLGNPGNTLNNPRDLCVVQDCGRYFGLVVNEGSDDLVRIDFQGNITSAVTGISLGNGGGMDFPHSISSIFREGNSLYAFITNAYNNTLTRLVFEACNSSSIPSSTQQQPPAVSYNAPGTYTINLLVDESLPTQSAFCKTVVVLDPPVVNLGNDTTICNGNLLDLDAGAGFTRYQWSTGAAAQQISVSQTGAYSVEVSNGGCTAADERLVNVSPVMQMQSVVTMIDCNNEYGSITVNGGGGVSPYTYALDQPATLNGNVFSLLREGVYTVTLRDQLGCEVSQTVPVQVDQNKLLDFDATVNGPTCYGLSDAELTVNVRQGVPPFEYAIDNGPFQSGNVFNNLAAGNYKVYTRNGVCVDSLMIVFVDPAELALQITTENERCGQANGSVAVTSTGGTPPYNFYWNNVQTTAQSWSGLTAGVYNVRIADARGCSGDTTVTLSNNILPPVRILNNDTTINIGERVQLVAVNAPDYVWTPATGLSCAACATPVAQPLEPTRYIVNTVTGENCVVADTVTIFLKYDRSLFVPTAFSPNGDGSNDLFRVKAKGVAVYQLQIYNRWGQLIFETNDVSRGWDGLFKNERQAIGSYVYVVRYAYFGSEKQVLEQKGTFSLIR